MIQHMGDKWEQADGQLNYIKKAKELSHCHQIIVYLVKMLTLKHAVAHSVLVALSMTFKKSSTQEKHSGDGIRSLKR